MNMRMSVFLIPLTCLGPALHAHTPEGADSKPKQAQVAEGQRLSPSQKPVLDRSGKKKKGKASYYARSFNGRKMADGTPMNPRSNIAASRTLPLGTKARVTNLENEQSAEVEVRDRGPYIAGRIIDLTPKTAGELGFKKKGVVPVEVAPIEVPQVDGSIMPGEGAG